MAPSRVAIVGAGPAGLVLAGTLVKEGPTDFKIDVFERDPRDRDQGAGWDIDEDAKRAFENAGLDWRTIARMGSDTLRTFRVGDAMPIAVKQDNGAGNPETNRQAMREGLLKTIGDRATVHWERSVADAKVQLNGGGIELIGTDGGCLGTFDFVVDASGGGSKLRKLRIDETSTAQYYNGITMVNGIIMNPEGTLDPQIQWMLGEGSVEIVGDRAPEGGFCIWLQRYGVEVSDKRTKYSSYIIRERPGQLAAELGLDHGVHLSNIGSDKYPEAVQMLRQYLKDQMGGKWPKMYHDMVDLLDPIQIYDLYQFPSDAKLKEDDTLPLVCIGDALHGMSPTSGSGGNLAVKDAAEVAQFLLKSRGNDASSICKDLHKLEKVFLKRIAFNQEIGRAHTEHFKMIYSSKTPVHEYFTTYSAWGWIGWMGPGCMDGLIGKCIAGYYWAMQQRNRRKGFFMPPKP